MSNTLTAGFSISPQDIQRMLLIFQRDIAARNASEIVRCFNSYYIQKMLELNEKEFRVKSASGRGTSGRYKPLGPQAAQVPRQGILDVTGRLHRAIMPGRVEAGSYIAPEGQSVQFDGNKAWVELDVPYAGFHQSGTRYMPQREVIATDPKTRREWQQVAKKYAMERTISYFIQSGRIRSLK